MLRYATDLPVFSTSLAADTISRIAYSTPLTFFEIFKHLDRYLHPLNSFTFGHVAQYG